MLTPRWLSKLTNVVRSSRGVQPSPAPASVEMRSYILRTFPASSAAPWWLVNTSPVSCQSSPAASCSAAWLPDQARSAWTAAAGRPRVRRDRSVLVSPCARTSNPPHRHARRHRRAGCGVAVQVDMRPAQRPGLLGADPAQQAEHDVGVHQFGRPADIFQPGPQFHHRQGPGGSDHCHGLVQGQRLGVAGRPS